MRVTDRFKNFAATICSSRETLVSEFLDVSTAVDHEFQSGLERARYARYIHALGCFQYGQRFLDELEEAYASGVVARPAFSLDPAVVEQPTAVPDPSPAPTRYVIRSMSTTDASYGQKPEPYHIYLLKPERRGSAYWSTSCVDRATFDSIEAAVKHGREALDRDTFDVVPQNDSAVPTYWDARSGKNSRSRVLGTEVLSRYRDPDQAAKFKEGLDRIKSDLGLTSEDMETVIEAMLRDRATQSSGAARVN